MGERWTGMLWACGCGTKSHCRVMASLCYSSSSGTLLAPSINAIFFVGDRVDGTANPEIERLSQLETIAAILVSKLGPSVNAWVVEPSHYKGSFACYENLLPSLTASGEPLGYNPKGLPASRASLSLLTNCLSQIRTEFQTNGRDRVGMGKQPMDNGAFLGGGGYTSALPCDPFSHARKFPRTIVLGFSKGGVVLNQLLAEIVHFEDSLEEGNCKSMEKRQDLVDNGLGALRETEGAKPRMKEMGDLIIPLTVEEFLRSVEEVHFVDVGLNCRGAYQTDPYVLEGLGRASRMRDAGLLLSFHGTPRQWQDRIRRWVAQEKDRCVALLRDAARKQGDGKLRVSETFYFGERRASLQMHFEIIEALVLS